MQYELAIANTPETIPGGTGLLLLHPSTGETDRIDTQFLNTDTDRMLVISTRTTAREVKQKLEHYEVDESKATILDTLSIERGYTRRQGDRVRYISAPDDMASLIDEVDRFLAENDGKLRISLDSITEMIYYADEEQVREGVEELLALLDEHDAVGLFHLAAGVHEDDVIEAFEAIFDGVIELDETDEITASF
jgi:KaiC/GvpD/RAD55 family RecA-like ATPase